MTLGRPIPESVTLHVPFRILKRGGRKQMQLPERAAQPQWTDNSLVKALARAPLRHFRSPQKIEGFCAAPG